MFVCTPSVSMLDASVSPTGTATGKVTCCEPWLLITAPTVRVVVAPGLSVMFSAPLACPAVSASLSGWNWSAR